MKKLFACLALLVLLAACAPGAPSEGDVQTAIAQTAEAIPTNTTEPTKAPKPTNTPEPTKAPEPTNTPYPTATSKPTIEVVEGLEISRDEAVAAYTKLDFTFEESTKVDGQPRIMGHSSDRLALLELIGPPDNLTEASLMLGLPKDNPSALSDNVLNMFGLLWIVLPDWDEGGDWVVENMMTAMSEGEVSTNYDNKTISLYADESGFLLLGVKAE